VLKSQLKKYSRFYLTAILSIFVVAGAVAAECPEDDELALKWLNKMSRSAREVSYQGVVTLQRGHEMQVLQVSHSVDQGRSSEVLTELTGQGAQVERASHPLDCIHPGAQLLRAIAEDGSEHCDLAARYQFSVADGERVAGRNAVRIKIEPRDMYRFGYVLALDRETGLLLKAQTMNHGRKTLETMQFAHLSYNDPVPVASAEDVIHDAHHHESESLSTSDAVAHAWSVGWLPRGFMATDSPLGTGGRRTYTDGLAVFSIFLEDLDNEIRPGEGLVKKGATTTYTRGMPLAGRPVLVTVIGEVPVNTARMVADSVRWVQ
jgi:sigma-E factor negative regulatory protein RseB